MPDPSSQNNIPVGFKLRNRLRGHSDVISRLAWSLDGRLLASGSYDRTIRVWEADRGQLLYVLRGHSNTVSSLAWSPAGETLASGSYDGILRLFDARTGQLGSELKGHAGSIYSVAWSPDGHMLASGGNDEILRLWDTATGRLRSALKSHEGSIYNLAWSPDGQTLATGGDDNLVRLWDTATARTRGILRGHAKPIYSVAWSPDGETLASGSHDQTVRLWAAESGQLHAILEGHTHRVTSIAFSFDSRLLASKSFDETVRLWCCETGENIAVLDESTSDYWSAGLAFNPTGPVLATFDEEDTVLRVWDLDFDGLLSAAAISRTISYTNAKVVLMGETGVGKTALGVRLTEGVWRPTPGSTHGMNVWPLYSEPEREVMLWDFAGQDEYRLVHQLFLNETNVALLLYDPTRSNDTFFGIDYWEKALKNVVTTEVQKILVAARVDVGGLRMMTTDIENYCKAHGYLLHCATSAETNEGCDELRAAIMAVIPWGRLPRTSSPEVFKRIKDFLTSVRQGNRILVREPDLRAEFDALVGEGAPTESEFRTVIGHVETAGLIKRFSFGDFVLLKPELLNGSAADIVDAARRHPDGLGAVRKIDVLDGRVRLKDEDVLRKSDRIFLLHATVELFLRLGLALEQDGNLVFPSKFNQQMPPIEEDPVVEVEFRFEGPVDNLYTTLVVKLYYGGIFRLKKLWKNAAEFLNARQRICGFQLHSEGDGLGTLKMFYADGVGDDDKALFLKIVADHFKEKHVGVERLRIYRCPSCREVVRDRNAISRAVHRDKDRIFCQDCGGAIPLVDALEILYRDDKKFLAQIAEMETRAEARMELGGELVSAAAELRTDNFKTWAGGANIATVAIVFTDVVDSTVLNVEVGDDRWRRVREAHFASAKKLINVGSGYLIKTIGDSVMAAFHSSTNAIDFALALQRNTGHESIRVRIGIHIGPVEVNTGDAFGQQVSMASRVEGKAKSGGIWVSARVKEDIDVLGASKHSQLRWKKHPNEKLKGFPSKYTLWSIEG